MSIIENIERLRIEFFKEHSDWPTLVIMTPDHRAQLIQEVEQHELASLTGVNNRPPEFHGMRIVRSWDFEEPVVGVL